MCTKLAVQFFCCASLHPHLIPICPDEWYRFSIGEYVVGTCSFIIRTKHTRNCHLNGKDKITESNYSALHNGEGFVATETDTKYAKDNSVIRLEGCTYDEIILILSRNINHFNCKFVINHDHPHLIDWRSFNISLPPPAHLVLIICPWNCLSIDPKLAISLIISTNEVEQKKKNCSNKQINFFVIIM